MGIRETGIRLAPGGRHPTCYTWHPYLRTAPYYTTQRYLRFFSTGKYFTTDVLEPCHAIRRCVQWLRCLCDDAGAVDTFAHLDFRTEEEALRCIQQLDGAQALW